MPRLFKTMNKFKLGDKVRIINNSGYDDILKIGKILTIFRISRRGSGEIILGFNEIDKGWYAWRFEKYNPIKCPDYLQNNLFQNPNIDSLSSTSK